MVEHVAHLGVERRDLADHQTADDEEPGQQRRRTRPASAAAAGPAALALERAAEVQRAGERTRRPSRPRRARAWRGRTRRCRARSAARTTSTTAPITTKVSVTAWRRRRSRALSRWSRGTLSHSERRTVRPTAPITTATLRASGSIGAQLLKVSLTSSAASLTCSPAFLTLASPWSRLALGLQALVAGRRAGGLLGLALRLGRFVRDLVVEPHAGAPFVVAALVRAASWRAWTPVVPGPTSAHASHARQWKCSTPSSSAALRMVRRSWR